MKIKEIVSALERFAPLPLQDGFDNAGLQVGLTEAEATGALLCLDVTEAVVDEAVMLGYNLIISHHPLIFKGYKSIIGRDYIERCVLKAIKNDIVIYSAHTNLDNAPGGVNYKIAEKIGLKNVRILDPKEEYLLKFVTFVPDAQADRVRKALFEAGCGCIGNYDSCSYNLEGEGTFRAQRGTSPFCGEIGELHKESEVRIETILPAFKKAAVIKALLATHPYEEPAFDIYPLVNKGKSCYIGRIGKLAQPEPARMVLRKIKRALGIQILTYAGPEDIVVEKVALCGGAGASFIGEAAAAGAQFYLTGDVKYHEAQDAVKRGMVIADGGHYGTEVISVPVLAQRLQNAAKERGWQVAFLTDPTTKDIFGHC